MSVLRLDGPGDRSPLWVPGGSPRIGFFRIGTILDIGKRADANLRSPDAV
jgi:hypothetical protein